MWGRIIAAIGVVFNNSYNNEILSKVRVAFPLSRLAVLTCVDRRLRASGYALPFRHILPCRTCLTT